MHWHHSSRHWIHYDDDGASAFLMPLWSRKKDVNHNEIVVAFQRLGFSVMEAYRAPHCPDLVVAKDNRVILVEVKSKGGKLSKEQQERFDLWPGETAVVSSVDDVLRLVQGAVR